MIIDPLLAQMSSVSTAQRKFMKVLLTTWMCLRGKATFRNLSRYSPLNEKTYARWFRRAFDFVEFNRLCVADILTQHTRLIAVMDCSFSEKSGRHTYGLDKFYSSTHHRAQKGLEISTLALVDVKYTTAYPLSTRQTPKLNPPDETRVERYLSHLRQDRHALPETVGYLVTDGYYSKKKLTDGVMDHRSSSKTTWNPQRRSPPMAAPSARLRKQFSAPSLLQTLRRHFETVPEHQNKRSQIPLADALMSGLAVFGLKYPSLLKFEEAYNEGVIRHNLHTLYGVERAPCDTQLRTILDPVDPTHLRPAFRAVHCQLQRHKALKPYQYLQGYYLVSIDGTGQFASSQICCPQCCTKTVKGQTHYYHQLLGAVMVHPDLKTVLPLAPEAITRQDGATK